MNLSMVEFLLQQAWQSIRRNGLMSLATSSNMTVALIILSSFFLVTVNLEHMADVEAHKASIRVELEDDADRAQVESRLFGDRRVASIEFKSKEEAFEDRVRRWADVLEEGDPETLAVLLGGNPLPDAIIVKPENPQDMPAIAKAAENIDGVAKVSYSQQVTDKLLTLARGIKVSGLVAAVLMGMATLLIVSTTIRLTIYARRREIRIMQLVGATNWFIRLPFILEGAFHGVMGGALATVLVLASYTYAHAYVQQHLEFLALIYDPTFTVLLGLGTLLCGVLFGVAGSWIGLRSYLRHV
ncbi:MAG: permease-like cell division protein FtsX [Armatimonadota bacterium]|nr:permease-like cell division protein FtsX [Armatimonadota bacterium]